MTRRRPSRSLPVTYDVYDAGGHLKHRAVGLQFAAEYAQLNDYDIEWAIEEYGRCDTDEFTIIQTGDPSPGPFLSEI
jgi:hypothetical protein